VRNAPAARSNSLSVSFLTTLFGRRYPHHRLRQHLGILSAASARGLLLASGSLPSGALHPIAAA